MQTTHSTALAEVCFGPMKSGKSRYLIHKAQGLYRQKQSFLAFKPLQDTRDGAAIRSRDEACPDIQALAVGDSRELQQVVEQALRDPQCFLQELPPEQDKCLNLRQSFRPRRPLTACLIDEVFLFDSGLLSALRSLRQQGVSVFMSGLDRDFRGEFFPLRQHEQTSISMKEIIHYCDHSLALMAFCEVCQQPAALTQRLINGQPAPYDSPTVLIGDEEYQPRCKEHHQVLNRPHNLTAVS